ncbi:hypothetical protein R3P38DRAFT_3305096 [Favolaschia claudopus]|uniref:C2H2-type domain-containing protein n=1 Tax=Favolaschia claudopus TaxID=2862362 RepID=A0AAW0DNA2_9AGAR
MASTSAPLPRPAAVVLPSIRDMFPEYVLPRARTGPTALKKPANATLNPPRSHPHPSFSFDVLKSHPTTSSLYHIASSRPRSKRPRHASPTDSDAESTAEAELMPSPKLPRTTRSSTAGSSSARRSPPSSSSGSSDAETEPDPEVDVDADHEDGGEHEGAAESLEEEGKRHACPTCGKRFNRPSSLRIHVNTHTGAMPFRCPHPSCGRAFNVNSNMRRHYRNHCTNASVMTHQYTSSLLTLSPSPASLSSTRTTPSSSPHSPPSTLSFHVKPSSANSTTMLIQTSFTKSSMTPASPDSASLHVAPPPNAVDSDGSSSSSSSYSDSAVSSPITPASVLTSACSLRFLPNPAPDASLERSPERWGVTPIDFSKWKNDELLAKAKAEAEEQLGDRDGTVDSGGESRVERSSPSPDRSPYLESDVRSAR